MDSITELGVEEVVVLKAAQVGFSECLRNLIGFWVDREPGPCLIVMPDQKSAEELIEERIKPLLEFSPAVARHVTSRAWDVKKSSIRLDTMSIYIGWAGSSQALKSRPIRYLLLEEPDEYPKTSGAGGDPISKAMKRVTTYAAKGRARTVIGGTPTTRRNNTWRAWEACGDRRHYWCPCPHCGRYQKLEWKQVRYAERIDGETRQAHAARVRDTAGAAHYECENPDCKGAITDAQKPGMLSRGVWAGEDQVVAADGRLTGPMNRRHRRVGYKISAVYSPWVSFAQLASEWIEAQDNVQALCDFINQRLAEPFEQQRTKQDANVIADRAKGGMAAGVVPKWALALIATADTQGTCEQDGYFWYVVRAWGYGYRSQLVEYGIARSKAELKAKTIDRQFVTENGEMVAAQVLWVDSGGPRWHEVYELAQNDLRVKATKGAPGSRTWMVTGRPQRRHPGVVLMEIDTEQSKDLLYQLIYLDPDKTKWMVHKEVGEDYCNQMVAESKVFDPRENKESWVEIVQNNNHLWDCEQQQVAAAWDARMGTAEPPPAPARTPDGPRATFGGNKRW